MNAYLQLIILLLLRNFVKCAPIQPNEKYDLDFIKQMGFMINTNDTIKMRDIIRDFQEMSNMTTTGILDEKTKTRMKKTPRCIPTKMKFKVKISGKWPSPYLKYTFLNYSSVYKKSTIEDFIQKGMKLWMDSSDLIFERTEDNSVANITIQFVNELSSEREDEQPLGLGAPPGDGRILYLDNLIKFKVDFKRVTAHEVGHTLGFYHSDNKTSIMYPMYIEKSLELNELDVKQVQKVYGKKYSLCNKGRIDAVVFIPSTETVYMMRGPQVWKFTSNKLVTGYPMLSSTEFPGLTSRVNASFYYNDHIYFIQDKNVLKFNKTHINHFDILDIKYDAALTIGERLYTFKGSEYWRYDISDDGMTKVRKSYPRNISSLWLGVPDNIDAVYYDYDVHFFKRKRYYRYDANLKEIPAVKMNISEWEGCKHWN